MKNEVKLFEQQKVRTHWDEEQQKWYFSISDVIAILTESIDPLAYWRKLKERLKKEGNETVTNSHGLKMKAADGWNKSGNGSNKSQFSALPGGGHYGDGNFGNAGNNGFWWSSTEYEPAFSWGRGLTYDSSEIYKGVNYKENGFSVRCVKDK